jgi:hypothetical protein
MELIVKRGTRNQRIRFLLAQEGDRKYGKTGLDARSSGLCVAYLREGDTVPVEVPLMPWESESHFPGGFREIDSRLMPGLYELGLPNEVCSEGANRATLMVWGPGLIPLVVHLDLVGYDPYDQDRLGLDCLSREARHDVISRAFREVIPEIVEEFRREG